MRHSRLAECPVDGIPLILLTCGTVVMLDCPLCDRALVYDGPREPAEPVRRQRNGIALTERPVRSAFQNDPRARAYMRAAAQGPKR
jgi:hypothetical protein